MDSPQSKKKLCKSYVDACKQYALFFKKPSFQKMPFIFGGWFYEQIYYKQYHTSQND